MEFLRRASLIIWDEVAMTKRQAVEALDRSLQDIMGCAKPFGGKLMSFGGNFWQVLRSCGALWYESPNHRCNLIEVIHMGSVRRIQLTHNS
jgi:ATP-dependent DNA helicase PIF1